MSRKNKDLRYQCRSCHNMSRDYKACARCGGGDIMKWIPAMGLLNLVDPENPPHKFRGSDAKGNIVDVSLPALTKEMSVLDYFAAHAPPMPGFWLDKCMKDKSIFYDDAVASWAFHYARSMMLERAKHIK